MPLVDVVFAHADKQWIIPVCSSTKASVEQVIIDSGILNQCPDINLDKLAVGIFGKVCTLDKIVEQGDRVEIYRPLIQNPMDARRNRAAKR